MYLPQYHILSLCDISVILAVRYHHCYPYPDKIYIHTLWIGALVHWQNRHCFIHAIYCKRVFFGVKSHNKVRVWCTSRNTHKVGTQQGGRNINHNIGGGDILEILYKQKPLRNYATDLRLHVWHKRSSYCCKCTMESATIIEKGWIYWWTVGPQRHWLCFSATICAGVTMVLKS